MSINYEETNRSQTHLREIPKIIGFLGYMPFDTSGLSLRERIITIRRCLGVSRDELAERLGVNESTIPDWGHGKRKPLRRNLKNLGNLVATV